VELRDLHASVVFLLHFAAGPSISDLILYIQIDPRVETKVFIL